MIRRMLLDPYWGGGTSGYTNIHEGNTLFDIKKISYFEESLKFVGVRNNYLINKNNYDIVECKEECNDNLAGFASNALLSENSDYFLTEDNNFLLY